MNTYETSELHKRVERYEAALVELRAAHQDVRTVLVDQVLYDRWQQIGAELGFVSPATPENGAHPSGQQHDPTAPNHQIPQMSESWAG